MSGRILLTIGSVIFLCSAALIPVSDIDSPIASTSASIIRPLAGTVWLGGASFTPTSIGAQGQASNLNIGIATSVDTSGASATVTVTEDTNFSGVAYTVADPSGTLTRSQTINLPGGGQSTTVTFKFKTTNTNSTGGSITSRVTLSSPTGATLGTPAQISNLTLTVTDPVAACDTCSDQQICWANRCISPIVIDTSGDGFDLTDAQNGVNFDITASGTRMRISWTSANSDDAWLVLDRNANGIIDDATELFGTLTPQAYSMSANGFKALAEYDRPENGGNLDERVDSKDAIFSSLRLWKDQNHNGFSDPGETFTLPALGVTGIDLKYEESKRTDQYGNGFRYRAKVYDAKGAHAGRWAWDVFLVHQ